MRQSGITILFLLVCGLCYPSLSIDFKEEALNRMAGNLLPNPIVFNDYSPREFDVESFVGYGLGALENLKETTALYEIPAPELSTRSFIYLYVSLIGFYIAIILHFNKKVESVAKALISGFIFIHSVFILHIFLYITKYQYQFPHTFRISTVFSFLYGPLLYLYFKRITHQYKFKKVDLLHFLPTLIFVIYLLPGYLLPADQKLDIMLGRIGGRSFSDVAIIVLKLLSLLTYGYFIRKLYLTSKKNTTLSPESSKWQRNIYIIHMLYVVCYSAYGFLLANNMTVGFLYHMQVMSMALMVMYLGYSANVQPAVFNGSYSFNKLFYKYEKSGLTESLSLELKENLIHLFDEEKVYKDSTICLETLSNKLDTTRHNTSQVINEHFNMSFHELINRYRIREAKEILNNDIQRNLNIIDVAYEVGYNNKVTFNKAFKKDTRLTPSQYQRIAIKSAV